MVQSGACSEIPNTLRRGQPWDIEPILLDPGADLAEPIEVAPGLFLTREFSVKQARVVTWSEVGVREATLVQRCGAGDEPACTELVGEHQRMVLQLGINLLGDRGEALDLSQEVFLRVFRTIHRFRGQSSLRIWIYRIAVNQARKRHRVWRRRHRADLVSLDEHLATHGDSMSTRQHAPERALAHEDLADVLQQALDGLPFEQRTIMVLREIDGLSYEEIAASLGVTVGNIKSRLTRARLTLRRGLRGRASVDK
jgi:RNA polymerase sigma-70 factor (ECF subfamily)